MGALVAPEMEVVEQICTAMEQDKFIMLQILLRIEQARRTAHVHKHEEREWWLKEIQPFDSDGNGQLTPQELKGALGALGIYLDHRQMRYLFRELDLDRGGWVSYEELYDAVVQVGRDRNSIDPTLGADKGSPIVNLDNEELADTDAYKAGEDTGVFDYIDYMPLEGLQSMEEELLVKLQKIRCRKKTLNIAEPGAETVEESGADAEVKSESNSEVAESPQPTILSA